MSQFSDMVTSRIHELTEIIKSKQSELAAYELVLQIESAKDGHTSSPVETVVENAPVPQTSPKFAGSKTAFVLDIVNSCGSRGAAPKDVRQEFLAQKVQHGENTVYDVLSYLVGQKRLARKDGRYFLVGKPATSQAVGKKSKAGA